MLCSVPQAVVNLDNVRSVPGLGLVAQLPFVTQVLQGILPSIGELLLLLLLLLGGGDGCLELRCHASRLRCHCHC